MQVTCADENVKRFKKPFLSNFLEIWVHNERDKFSRFTISNISNNGAHGASYYRRRDDFYECLCIGACAVVDGFQGSSDQGYCCIRTSFAYFIWSGDLSISPTFYEFVLLFSAWELMHLENFYVHHAFRTFF